MRVPLVHGVGKVLVFPLQLDLQNTEAQIKIFSIPTMKIIFWLHGINARKVHDKINVRT